eukprot:6594072-Prymnesium_polylepis.1
MLHTGVRAASRRWGVPCARGGHGDDGACCGVLGRCGQRGRHSCGTQHTQRTSRDPGSLGILCRIKGLADRT